MILGSYRQLYCTCLRISEDSSKWGIVRPIKRVHVFWGMKLEPGT